MKKFLIVVTVIALAVVAGIPSSGEANIATVDGADLWLSLNYVCYLNTCYWVDMVFNGGLGYFMLFANPQYLRAAQFFGAVYVSNLLFLSPFLTQNAKDKTDIFWIETGDVDVAIGPTPLAVRAILGCGVNTMGSEASFMGMEADFLCSIDALTVLN